MANRPEREYQVPHSKMVELQQPMNCVMCGACVSDCTVLEETSKFLAPAALAKARTAWLAIHAMRKPVSG